MDYNSGSSSSRFTSPRFSSFIPAFQITDDITVSSQSSSSSSSFSFSSSLPFFSSPATVCEESPLSSSSSSSSSSGLGDETFLFLSFYSSLCVVT
jgi:hypothetical protein